MLLIKEKSIYWLEISLSNNQRNKDSRNALRDTEWTWKMEVYTHFKLQIWTSLKTPWINHWPTRGSSHPTQTWTSYGWIIYGMLLLFICLIQLLARLRKELVVLFMILILFGSIREILDMSHITFYDPRISEGTWDNQSCNLTFYKTFFCGSTRIWLHKYTKHLQNNYKNYKY